MPGVIGPQPLDCSRIYELDLVDSGGNSLAGDFTGSEIFGVKCWDGADGPNLATFTAGWIQYTLAQVSLTVTKAAIAGLLPGYYTVRVILNPAVDDVEVW